MNYVTICFASKRKQEMPCTLATAITWTWEEQLLGKSACRERFSLADS